MSYAYAQKQFIVKVSGKAEDDGFLKTKIGDMRVKKGDLILRDYNDHYFTTTEKFFAEDYVPVKVIDTDIKKMKKGYEEMGKINLEEANSSVHTYNDGMDFYKE